MRRGRGSSVAGHVQLDLQRLLQQQLGGNGTAVVSGAWQGPSSSHDWFFTTLHDTSHLGRQAGRPGRQLSVCRGHSGKRSAVAMNP